MACIPPGGFTVFSILLDKNSFKVNKNVHITLVPEAQGAII